MHFHCYPEIDWTVHPTLSSVYVVWFLLRSPTLPPYLLELQPYSNPINIHVLRVIVKRKKSTQGSKKSSKRCDILAGSTTSVGTQVRTRNKNVIWDEAEGLPVKLLKNMLYSRTNGYRVMMVLLDVGIVIQSHGVSPRMETRECMDPPWTLLTMKWYWADTELMQWWHSSIFGCQQ